MVDENQIIELYQNVQSIKTVSKHLHVCISTVRRVLFLAGEHTNQTGERISQLAAEGLSQEEISQRLNLSPNTVNSYMPYSRGSYALGEKTENAVKIASWRQKKRFRMK